MLVGTGPVAAATPSRTGPAPDLQRDDDAVDVAATSAAVGARLATAAASSKKDQARVDRLAGDAELVAQVRARGCEGALYAALEVELVRYGRSVLSSWVKRGQIFASVTMVGRPVQAPEWARTLLRHDVHEREDLVAMVVAEALPAFRRDALEGGRWQAGAGASVTTYFVNLLVRTFPNHYRTWLAQQRRWRPWSMAEATMFDAERGPLNDPAALVGLRIEIEHELGKLNPRQRRVMAAYIDGSTQAEIAAAEGVSEKAVERVIHRSRQALHRLKTRETA